jgi:uncharacterized protein (TIGR02217 family)
MTQNYIDHKISTQVSRDFQRVVSGKTDITPLANGRENRNAAWAFKKMKFSANYAMLTPESQLEVASAFYACNAMLFLFRFRDAGDYEVTDSPLIVRADEVGFLSPVQLTKRYTFGPVFADRMIQAVTKCVVKDHTGTVVPGAFDGALGLFTPTAAWGSGTYTWSGQFDVWVRFNSDDLDMTMMNIDMATSDVELIEQVAYNSAVHGS